MQQTEVSKSILISSILILTTELVLFHFFQSSYCRCSNHSKYVNQDHVKKSLQITFYIEDKISLWIPNSFNNYNKNNNLEENRFKNCRVEKNQDISKI